MTKVDFRNKRLQKLINDLMISRRTLIFALKLHRFELQPMEDSQEKDEWLEYFAKLFKEDYIIFPDSTNKSFREFIQRHKYAKDVKYNTDYSSR